VIVVANEAAVETGRKRKPAAGEGRRRQGRDSGYVWAAGYGG